VLGAVLTATNGTHAVVIEKPADRRRVVIGCRAGGIEIGRPDKLIRPRVARQVLETGRVALVSDEPPRPPHWCLGVPVDVGTDGSAALFVEGSARRGTPRFTDEETSWLSRVAALSMLVDALRERCSHLEEQIERPPADSCESPTGPQDSQRPASAPPRPATPGEPSRPANRARLTALFPEIVCKSVAMRDVLSAVGDLARSEIPILIDGESGTGKELIARAIHRLSSAATGPFVSENCGAIPEHLGEAELFGRERGAFTGASDSQPGLVERASGGTLFLDEVGEMGLELQKKLLRVLQERTVRRIGGRRSIRVGFRLISATNRDLEAMVKAGTFRQDLFFRLHVASVHLPALRERPEDVPDLVEQFNRQHSKNLDRAPLEFGRDTLAHFRSYAWPGNVRELGNEVWRLATTVGRHVRPSDLSKRILRDLPGATPADRDADLRLEPLEREVLGAAVLKALQRAKGNRTRAAGILGVTRAALYRRMQRYGIKY